MKILLTIFGVCVAAIIGATVTCGMKWIHRRNRRRAHERAEREVRFQEFERRQQIQAKREKLLSYPAWRMTQAEFDKIPHAEDLPDGFLTSYQFGFQFVCRRQDDDPDDIIVVGEIVRGEEGIQWGAGLAVPERLINRYRVQLVEATADALVQEENR